MQQCDTLILPGWCIPVEPDGLVLTDHAVAVDDGRIVAILPADAARSSLRPGRVISRPNHVLIPGLINAHTHAAMSLLRGIGDDLPLERWLRERIWPAEKRWVSAEMVRDGTRHAIAEMLLAGTTCFSDQYFFPEIVAETASEMHVRAMIGTPVIDFPTAWAANASECLAKGAELVHDRFAEHALISSCFAPHSAGTLSDDAFSELRIMADQLDVRVQIHLHESQQEIRESIAATALRPLARLAKLGLVNSSLLVVHGVYLDRDEISQLAAARVSVAHCPRSNLKLADGIAPVARYLSGGVNVALGTDGAASNNALDLLDEMKTAALLAKVSESDARTLPAAAALRMATLGGATALGLAEATGSIENGKWADLTCIDMQHFRTQPIYDAISQLVYSASSRQVSDVWIAGRHLVENGTLTQIDGDEILRRTNEWQQRIASHAGE
ncbi:MAG: TRZ/ATZ family hydrolase [Gammaproteobacteria bacterium]|nr:TRZ/ATZ family hydrolase [Gammaproteobacteria bacterium]